MGSEIPQNDYDRNFSTHSVSVRFVEPQQQIVNYTKEITEEELDTYLRYSKSNNNSFIMGNFKDKNIPMPIPSQKRINGDSFTQGNYNREFFHKKYVDMGLPTDDITLRVEIRTDMKIY